jgi:hypothetical protein
MALALLPSERRPPLFATQLIYVASHWLPASGGSLVPTVPRTSKIIRTFGQHPQRVSTAI